MKYLARVLLCFALLICISANSADGQIIINKQPRIVYNVGDSLILNFSVSKDIDTSAYVDAFILCDDREELIYRTPFNFEAGQYANFSVGLKILDNLQGNCSIKIESESDDENSAFFAVVNQLDVTAIVNNKMFSPGEKIYLNGTVRRGGAKLSKGVGQIIFGNFVNQSFIVNEGAFYFNYQFPDNAPALSLPLNIQIFEKDNKGEVLNRGYSNLTISIKSVPAYIQAGGPESFSPPLNAFFNISLLNQMKGLMQNESLLVRISDPNGTFVFEKSVQSGERFNYSFRSSAQKGAWGLIAYYGQMYSYKSFYLLESKVLSIKVENSLNGNYLNITNVGNSPYEQVLDVALVNESSSFNIPLNLALGQGESYIYYPDIKGSYNVQSEFSNISSVYFSGITAAAIAGNYSLSGSSGKMLIVFAGIIVFAIVFVHIKRKRNYRRRLEGYY